MFQDVEEQGLTNRSEELKHNASSLLTEALNAEKDLRGVVIIPIFAFLMTLKLQ